MDDCVYDDLRRFADLLSILLSLSLSVLLESGSSFFIKGIRAPLRRNP